VLPEEIYPNSPLAEVVCEIRFPGEVEIEGRRHEFFAKVRDEYPNVLVPPAQAGKHLALEPYRFEREDKTAGIMVAMNLLALYARDYPGFARFKAEFMRLHRLFGQTFTLDRLTRVGWRYINVIPFARQEGLIPLAQFLKVGFQIPRIVPERIQALDLTLLSKTDRGAVTTKLTTMLRDPGGQEAILLDFDYSKEQDLQFSQTAIYLDEAHAFTRGLFEELITDEYRQYLKGEVLE
jgi:uncharacterized protein (TIGR04255 family)